MAITTWAATTGDWDDPKFSQSWDGPAIEVGVASLSLSPSWTSNTNTWAEETLDWQYGLEPSYKFGINSKPGVATLEFIQSYEWNQISESWQAVVGDWESGPVPHVAVSDPRNPITADLTLTGSSAPTVGIKYNFPVSVGELTTTLTAPSVGEALHITPEVGSMEFIQSYEWNQLTTAWDDTSYDWETGPSPSVAVGSGISPAKGDMTLAGSAPSLTFEFTLTPDNADLTLAGSAPVDNFGKSFDVANADLSIVDTYDWNNYGGDWASATTAWNDVAFAPDAVETGQNQPSAGALIFSATAPSRTIQKLWYVPTADLTLSSSDNPFAGFSINVGAGSLTGLSSFTWETFGGDWASASGAWNQGTTTPTAGVTYIFPIDETDLSLTTYDPQWPLIGDPNYIAQVVLS